MASTNIAAEPEMPSNHRTHNPAVIQSVLDNNSSESLPIEYPVVFPDEQVAFTHAIDNSESGSHPSSVGFNPASLQEISNVSISGPVPGTSEEQFYHAVDRDALDSRVSSPTQPADSIAHSGLSHSVSDILDERRDSGLTSTNAKPEPPLPILESLGFSGLASLVGGHIGILGVLAFLTFLWFGFGPAPEAAKATSTWRQIALSDWMTRSITLSSLAIRFLATLQATVCTSMVAALILERRRARKSYVPWFSVIRSINDGPMRLVQMLLTSKTISIVFYPEFWLAALMVLITLALQFSSTVLLSDLHSFEIVGNYNDSQVPSLISYNKSTFDVHLNGFEYLARAPVFSTFGEVQTASSPYPNSRGLSDTGLLQRGFLPFAGSENRTSTRQYSGNAIVMSSRAACMRPVIRAQYGYNNESGNFAGNGVLVGEIQYAASFREAQITSLPPCDVGNCDEEAFLCEIPSSSFGDWQATACKLNRFGMTPSTLSLLPKWTPPDTPWSANASVYLLQTTNMREDDWAQVNDTQSLSSGESFHEWQSYEILPGRFVNLTLCYMGVALERNTVEMESSGGLREPVIDGSQISRVYNTNDVQRLFGVNGRHENAAERGILNMTIVGEPQDGPTSGEAYDTISVGDAKNITIARFTSAIMELVLYAQAIEVIGSNTTLPFCSFCSIIVGANLATNMGLILNDIVTQSGRAANALSTYLTIVASAVYYDYLGALSGLQEAGTVLTTSVLVPGPCSEHSCRGYISVAVLLVIHLVYVTIVTLLYIRQARYSRYANVWHTTSQLVSGELKETWGRSNNASDSVVTKTFVKEGKDDFMELGRLDLDGQIGFRKTKEAMKQKQEPGMRRNSTWSSRLTLLKSKLSWKGGRS
ncbi:hypothetical protein GGR51DRAFT_520440 [Nemania sp. FL0031]|nr:hypothetical protein GGR51DRAFT_520440 [Nemania sp. FL0031]